MEDHAQGENQGGTDRGGSSEEEVSGRLRLLAMKTLTPLRAIKMNLANEGLEARKKEEEVATKKRKAEEDKAWEGKYSSCGPPS